MAGRIVSVTASQDLIILISSPNPLQLLHPFEKRRGSSRDKVEAKIPLSTGRVVRLNHGIVYLSADAQRYLSDLKCIADADTDGYGPSVAAVLFPVGEDVRGCTDG